MNQMLTSQWLLGGEVIYWTSHQFWSENFTDGAVFAEQVDAEAALLQAEEFVKQRAIVAPYLIEVDLETSVPKPISARERIRATHNTTFKVDHGSWSVRLSD